MTPWARPLLVLILASLAGPALAAAPPPVPAEPPAGRVFISPSGEPFRPQPGERDPFETWFARVDTNHDGRIDRAEFRADALAFFKVLDANGDGRIDGFETFAYEHKIAPELIAAAEGGLHQPGEDDGPRDDRRARGPRDPVGRSRGLEAADRGRRGFGAHGFISLLNEPEPVTSADTDLDSRITAAEWLATTDSRFDMLDVAKTGFLTRDPLLVRFPKPGKPKR